MQSISGSPVSRRFIFSEAPGTTSHCVPGTSRPGSLHHSAAFSVDSLMQNHATLETGLQDVRTRVTIVEAHFCGDMHYRNVAMCFTRASNSASNSSTAADDCWLG